MGKVGSTTTFGGLVGSERASLQLFLGEQVEGIGYVTGVGGTRATQFWDKGRLVSNSMVSMTATSLWDYIALYPPGAVWEDHPPEELYHGEPVVRVTEPARVLSLSLLDVWLDSVAL